MLGTNVVDVGTRYGSWVRIHVRRLWLWGESGWRVVIRRRRRGRIHKHLAVVGKELRI